ncbi:MAG: PEP-utilizing enzyme [Myxococcota bacterium]
MKRASAWRAVTAFFVVLAPGVAYALPSPLVLGMALELLAQAVILLALSIPFGLRRLREAFDARLPYRWQRAVMAFVLLLAPGAFRALGDAPAPALAPAPAPGEGCEPISAELAETLHLTPGAYVIDPRPPEVFAAYHLRGSCNVRDLRGFALAHADAPAVYVADDTDFPVHRLTHPRLRSLPGGLQRVYKPRGFAFGWGDAPEAIVGEDGDAVTASLGPLWFMGEHGYVAPARLLPAAALSGRTVLDLRDEGHGVPAYDAYPDRLDGLEEVVLICDDPPSCLAADALGADPRVRGKVRLRGEVPQGPVLSPAWLALLLVLLFATALALRRRAFGPALAAIALPLAAFGPQRFAHVYYAIDAPWVLPLCVLAALAILFEVESRFGLGRIQRRTLRLTSGAALLVGVGVELFGQGSGGVNSLLSMGLLAVALGLIVGREIDARTLVPSLASAKARDGGKAQRLGDAIARGAHVPRGFVVRDSAEQTVVEALARVLGGPLVVRSSAIGEDAAGGQTAGRYESLRGATPVNVWAAIRKVRGAYDRGAVVVQRERRGPHAGVSEERALRRVLVSHAEGSSEALMTGEGPGSSELLRRDGGAKGWRAFLIRLHDRQCPPRGAIQCEWVFDGGTLWCVQVREVAAAPMVRGDAHDAFVAARAHALHRGSRMMLDGRALADFDGGADATRDLLERLIGGGRARREAERIVGVRTDVPGPAVLRLGGRFYVNVALQRPFRRAFTLPYRRLRRLVVRMRSRAAIERVRLAVSHASRVELGRVEDVLPAIIAVSLLARLLEVQTQLAGDPYLEQWAREGKAPSMAGRTENDLRLSLAREGCEDPVAVPETLPAERAETLSLLRGLARRVLARQLVAYRGRCSAEFLKPVDVQQLPASFTREALERFAVEGRTAGGADAGQWVGRAAPGDYVLGETAALLDAPTPSAVMAVAESVRLIVARRGSPLSHGALLARERGKAALFGVGAAQFSKAESEAPDLNGRRLRVCEDGRVQLLPV